MAFISKGTSPQQDDAALSRKLFWDTPYAREFSATVVDVRDQNLVLDQTLFYPRGGGVACDTGLLNGKRVSETLKQGDDILHVVELTGGFSVGETATGVVDWDRRHRLMRMHTAGHLLSSLFYSRHSCLITGNQIDADKSRMDFNLEAFDRTLIERIVADANQLVAKDAPVKTYFLPREVALKTPDLVKLAEAAPPTEQTLRIVEIEGIDRQADGGLHVQRLGEVGEIKLLKLENKGKNNRRLYYNLSD